MKPLADPAAVAALAIALGAGIQPSLRMGERSEAAAVAVVTLALLLTAALVVRARRPGWAGRVLALGAVLAISGLALDGGFAHRGEITLAVGQAKNNFEEMGPGGRGLGLRPLGFEAGLARAANGRATLTFPPDVSEVEVLPARAVARGAFRFGDPRTVATGEAARLSVAVSGPSGSQTLEVVPDGPTRTGDVEVELERYFPDFALDEQKQPFSRSTEPKNPAALLRVRRGERTFRVFVIRAMPGLHHVEGLDQSFSLLSVEPEVAVRLRVTSEPGASLMGAAALALLVGVGLTVKWG